MNNRSVRSINLKILGLSIAISLAIVGVGAGYCSFIISGTTTSLQWWGEWLQDVATEMLGASVTILLVELVIYQKRDEASRINHERMRRREHFVSQLMASNHSDKRRKLINRMKQQDLLAGAWLYELDLQHITFQDCNLQEADLFGATLTKANLESANLTKANLRQADLRQCCLRSAVLREADLTEANLQGADLFKAVVQDADFSHAKCSITTRLPDGTFWEPGVDLGKVDQSEREKRLIA